MRTKVCFAAEGVIRDFETNTISAYKILEGVGAAGFPFFLPHVSLFVLWERDPGDPEQYTGRFSAIIGGQRLLEVPMPTVAFQGTPRARSIFNLNGIVIPAPGNLEFHVVVDEGPEVRYVVEIAATPAEVVARNPGAPR